MRPSNRSRTTTLPGHLPSLVAALKPADQGGLLIRLGSLLDNATRKNVILNVEKLKAASPIIDKAVADKKVRIVGAVYNFGNGRVELVS